MAGAELPPDLKNLLYAQEHRLLDDDVGRAATRIIKLGIDDDFARDEVASRVRNHEIAQAFAGPIRQPRLHSGQIILGFDAHGNFIRVPISYLNGHSLTLGNTGAAKTTKTRFLVPQIAPYVPGLWLFDCRKREFAILHLIFQAMGMDLRIVPTRALRINPLQPPDDTDPARFAPRAADILVHVLGLPPRATKLLHATIHKLYRDNNVYAGSRQYPTLYCVRDALLADKGANPPARNAIVDSLEPVLASLGSAVLGHHVGWSSQDLAKRHIVFDLSDAEEVDKALIINCLLEMEFTYRIAHGVSNSSMALYIACDEAASLVSASAGSLGLTQRIGLIRGTGIGMDLSVQSSDIAPAILSNTANKFVGRCGSAADYNLIGGAMGLTGEQRQWMASRLRPGLFVAQVAEGDWRHPFLLETPELNFPASLHVPSESLGDLASLEVIPAAISHAPEALTSPKATAVVPSPSPTHGLSHVALNFLDAVSQNPGLPSSHYAKLAGIGASQAVAVRQDLLSRRFLREHRVNTGARGRSAIVLELLPPATAALNTPGHAPRGSNP